MRTAFLPLAFLVSYAYSETCPPDEDLYPCTCDEQTDSGNILVICSDDSFDLEKFKEALKGKQNVDLELNDLELGSVPASAFLGIGIKRLDMHSCELDTLADGDEPSLLGLENTLEELTIASSFTEETVPAKLNIGHLKRLRELDLSYNIITKLGDDWFENGPSSLEHLTISNNGIEEVGPNAFVNLINLKELLLDGNRFGPIKRSFFPNPARSLEVLELQNNALTSIPEDMFSNMPVLSRVSFNTNGILRLEERTWQPVWEQLRGIHLEGNPIECTSHMEWIFSRKRTMGYIYGKCHSPNELQGKSLQEFIDSGRF